jgi:hypothetical protein
MNKIRVTGNIVSKNGITLFMDDGTSMVLNQNEFRTKDIMSKVLPGLVEEGFAEVDLDDFSLVAKLKELTNTAIPIDETGALTLTTKDGKSVKTEVVNQLVEQAINKDPKGLKAFLAEVAKIKRGHTVEELLTFIKVGKMMIADDGSIVAYKILLKRGDELFDPHTGKVAQKLGAIVYMPASKVDDDRRNACSTGLHVCSASYIRGFWGNDRVLTLIKVKPSDVIAVPNYDTTKMRASAYHIVAMIPASKSSFISSGGDPMSDPELATIYNKVLAGDHIGITRRVEVMGAGSHKIEEVAPVAKKKSSVVKKVVAAAKKALTGKRGMSPKEVRQQVADLKAKTAKVSAPKPETDRAASDARFAEAFKTAKKVLKTKTGKANFSLRAFCKTHGISRTRLTLRLKEAGLLE